MWLVWGKLVNGHLGLETSLWMAFTKVGENESEIKIRSNQNKIS